MADVTIDIIAKDSFSGVLGNFGNIMTGINSIVNLATQAFNNLVAPVIDFGQEAVLAAARVNELGVVNEILAENAGIAISSLDPLVESIRDQGIEAGIAEGVVAAFIRAELDLADATDLARVAQDAAVISGMNSSETLDNIIYGITTLNPLVLRHAGIIVDLQLSYKEWAEANDRTVDSLTTAEKQNIAMNAVMEAGTAIAGSYAAAMEEPGKVLRSFPRYFDDIMVAIGQPFQDAFAEVLFAFADLAKWVGTAVEEGGALRPVLETISLLVGLVADNFADAVTSITGFLDATEGGFADNPFVAWLQGLIDSSTEIDEVLVGIRSIKENFDEFGTLDPTPIYEIVERIDADLFLQNLKDDIKDKLKTVFIDTDWGDVSDAIVEKIDNLDFNIGTSGTAFVESIKKIAGVVGDQFAEFDWEELVLSIDDALGRAIDSVDWEETGLALNEAIKKALKKAISGESIGNYFKDETGKIDWVMVFAPAIANLGKVMETQFGSSAKDAVKGFVDGLLGGPSNRTWWDVVRDAFFPVISIVKTLFGIESPSTVFMQIGRDLINGLIIGIGTMVAPMLSFLGTLVNLLLLPFQPLLDLIGTLTGSGDVIGTGDVIDWGNGNGTPSTGASTVTNNYYFYGAVYMSGVGQEGTYDCPSPNPLISATSSSLSSPGFA